MNGDKAIVPRKFHNSITRDEFRKHFFDDNYEERSLIDKTSDAYDELPIFLKVAKNIDPTGLLSCIDDVLAENKSKREQNRMIDAIYYLYLLNLEFSNGIQEVIKSSKEQAARITELYFQKCKESIDEEKIKYYASVWFESITNSSQSFDEKEYVFALVSSLTLNQINVLKYIYGKFFSDFNFTLGDKATNSKRPVCIKAFAEENKLNYPYVQQICIDLQGKGLLQSGAESLITSSSHYFFPTDYVDTLIKYLQQIKD